MYNFSVTRADAEGLFWARGVELDLAVRIEQSPVSLVLHLPIVTLTHRLPRLVKGLKVEDIHTPSPACRRHSPSSISQRCRCQPWHHRSSGHHLLCQSVLPIRPRIDDGCDESYQ